MIHNIFLKRPFGSLAHLRFLISFCPNIAIANNIQASQSVYAISALRPSKNPAGRIIASIRV